MHQSFFDNPFSFVGLAAGSGVISGLSLVGACVAMQQTCLFIGEKVMALL